MAGLKAFSLAFRDADEGANAESEDSRGAGEREESEEVLDRVSITAEIEEVVVVVVVEEEEEEEEEEEVDGPEAKVEKRLERREGEVEFLPLELFSPPRPLSFTSKVELPRCGACAISLLRSGDGILA